MAVGIYERIYPLRKPKDFVPAVQRWSVALPNRFDRYFVAFFGVQGESAKIVYESPFFPWVSDALMSPDAPDAHDYGSFVDDQGQLTHIVAMYWIGPERYGAWMNAPRSVAWWSEPKRLHEQCGYFRECMTIPVDRQETLYWQDYPAGFSRATDVACYPTPYCGYYGAMRDRIPIAAADRLETRLAGGLLPPAQRDSKGARWRIRVPYNLSVIRSGVSWERCDDDQYQDFMTELRQPLDRGMDYLRQNATETGCCALRYLQTCDAAGNLKPETHAIGYFLSLSHLENWAEGHPSHHAIFSAAIARYRKYGKQNQLRTWHEVFVLPEDGHVFEYVNCAPMTGLLPYFEGDRF